MAHNPDGRPLIGSLVRLDPTQAKDETALVEALDDPRVFALGFAGGASDRAAAIGRLIAGAGESRSMYTIRLASDTGFGAAGEVVGTTSLGDLEPTACRAHAGWTAYRPDLWGKGLNAEVKLLLLGHAFEDCGFERVKLQTDSINERSQKAIARLGAVREECCGTISRVPTARGVTRWSSRSSPPSGRPCAPAWRHGCRQPSAR